VVVNRQVMLRTIHARAEAERAAFEAQKAADAKPPAAPATRSPRSPFGPGDMPSEPVQGTPPAGIEEGPPPKAIPPVVARADGSYDLEPPPGYFDLPAPGGPEGSKPPTIKPGQVLAVEVLEALPGRPITGERVVRPDGTISLGFYGDLRVAGLNRNQVKVKLLEHLRKYINDDMLGLIVVGMRDNTFRAVPPVESNRVFIDESANYYPEGPEKASRPKVRGKSIEGDDLIRGGRLDIIEGKIHRVVKDMDELKAALKSPGPADPNEPGISDAEKMKRVEAEVARKNSEGQIDSLEGELYQLLKELKDIRAEGRPAEASPATPPARSPG
jgi:Polysaccharide biosynthesis/export protein